MVLKSLKFGFAQMWAHKRLVLVFYLANLFFGLLLLLPLRSILNSFIGHSQMGAALGGRIDMDFVFELLQQERSALAAWRGLLLLVPAAYWLFGLFLSGGALAILVGDDKYRPSIFWGNAANYFGRFCRLVLWCLPVLGALFCLQYLETAVVRIFWGSDPFQSVTHWGNWIKNGIFYLSILLFGLVFDYARIQAVLTGERRMRKSLWQTIRFVVANLPQTFTYTLLLFLISIGVLAIYNLFANQLVAASTVVVLLLVLLQQLFLFVRMMLKLTLFAGQIKLYRELTTAPETPPLSPEILLEQAGI